MNEVDAYICNKGEFTLQTTQISLVNVYLEEKVVFLENRATLTLLHDKMKTDRWSFEISIRALDVVTPTNIITIPTGDVIILD